MEDQITKQLIEESPLSTMRDCVFISRVLTEPVQIERVLILMKCMISKERK